MLSACREAVHRGGLAAFAREAWSHIDPAPLRWSWHHDLICDRLERVSRGEVKRLIVSVPPGTTKTILASVLWPAWDWIGEPTRKWIAASYGEVSLDAARLHRDLVTSPWYRYRWPHVEIPYQQMRAASAFKNSLGGFRYSTSVGGPLTGRHANIQLADDLNKAQDALLGAAYTQTALDAAWEFWAKVLVTRQGDPVSTRRVLVAQRLHEKDVPGRWQADDDPVEVLCLPMRFVADHPQRCPDDPRSDGELLWPDHYPEATVAALERALGPQDASAQLQQLPQPLGGGVFQGSTLVYYDRAMPVGRTIQSWDLAFKGAPTSDHVAGEVWRFDGQRAQLLDVRRGRWDFVESVDALVDLTLTWPESSREVLVEDKANGPALEAELRRSYRERCERRGVADPPPLTIRLVNPQGGKLARAHAVTSLFASGCVELPRSAPWLASFQHELLRFAGRGAEQDDQVDAATQALTHLFGSAETRWADAMRRYRAGKAA